LSHSFRYKIIKAGILLGNMKSYNKTNDRPDGRDDKLQQIVERVLAITSTTMQPACPAQAAA